MEKHALIAKTKYLLYEISLLEKDTKKIFKSLENDYIDKETALNFNCSVCFVGENGMSLVNDICNKYQKHWEEFL